ncbi:endonuclease/exonuclease/phosphatase family protein [Streptomyces sp. NPDC002870]|uniref:endonuclease/exonuclease/phosphatase family protein n=1 Tax=Streptomyces sp. NPDC002870 TaxID=3364666 RepID=UPI00369C1FE8
MTAPSDTLTPPPTGPEASSCAAAVRRWPPATRVLVTGTALWALFTILNFALSGRWWLWLVPDLAPPLLFLAVPALLLAVAPTARPVRRWLIPVLLLLLMSGAPRAGIHWGALLPGGGQGPSPEGALKVFSWNTQYWETSDDSEAFYRYLKAKDADVYLLQEYLAWEHKQPKPIDELARVRREFPDYHIAIQGELVTLSRYPIVARPAVGRAEGINTDTPWQQVFERGRVLRTDLNVRGSVVSVYNVHIPVQIDIDRNWLSSGFYHTVRERDAERRDHYAALEQDAAANSNPLLISGDFNTTPAMGDLRALRDTFNDALPASTSVHPGTWNSEGLALWRLDWVFTNDRLRVHSYEFEDPAGLSDHRGQDVVVSLKK